MNRSLSVRSKKDGSSGGDKSVPKHRFTLNSLRGNMQPDLSKKLYKLIKAETHAIGAYETAGRERSAIAGQLSDWGEETQDDAVSDLSDKLGVLLSEIGEQEDNYASNLEEARVVLKAIRNTERSVQPSRDHKSKVGDELQKLKYKEPSSPRVAELEQELVRSEAQNLVAEAQLTNVTRQKMKESFDIHLAATIERAEKQMILAKQARRLLTLLDDKPIVPGDTHPVYDGSEKARQILSDAEDELRAWTSTVEPIPSQAGQLSANAMPASTPTSTSAPALPSTDTTEESVVSPLSAGKERETVPVSPPETTKEATTAL